MQLGGCCDYPDENDGGLDQDSSRKKVMRRGRG